MTIPETVQEYSRRAAESFIQTAVFVDDRIYSSQTIRKDEIKKTIAPKMRKRVSKKANKGDEKPENVINDADGEDPAPDAYDIVNYFAKKQIVCSLYQPKKDAAVTPSSDIFPLCKAADVVVIDWDLYGDKGQKAKELADGLVKQAVEDVPEQLRLILIYTQELNLGAIANELYETIHSSIGDDFRPVEGEEGLVFHTKNSRIVVLGKPGRARVAEYQRFIIDEKELADIAVKEFSKLASGILHAATLLGLSMIRQNSRKVLSKFSAELDPAFLTHVAMCFPEEDASSHVIPLLVSEIEAVLEDALPSPLVTDAVLEDWCENVWKPAQHINEFLNEGDDAKEVGKAILTKGFIEPRKKFNKIPKIGGNSSTRKASKIFLQQAEDLANHKFSHLMSSRTFYGEVPRVLSLGTILYDNDGSRYLLCLQPVCDSVRVDGKRKFLFTELGVSEGISTGKATHVVFKQNRDTLELIYEPKSYFCVIEEFKATAGKRQVIAKSDDSGNLVFYDVSERTYEWIDQLKASHAQRAVELLASDLSRVGLTESEWLRSLNKK
ncbi:MAG: response regulator receiver domain [Stappiaceae bacterium]